MFNKTMIVCEYEERIMSWNVYKGSTSMEEFQKFRLRILRRIAPEIIQQFEEMREKTPVLLSEKRRSAELELFEYAFSLGMYSDEEKKYEGKELLGWRAK